jgi:flavorubredoxin
VALLNKAAKAVGLDNIKMLCPLHGPVWRKDLGYIIDKYTHWATYEPEEKGVMIVYASMYGNTEAAAEVLAAKLAERGVLNTRLYDVSSTHVSYLISDLFKYSHLVLASVTYNLGIFPPMHNFLADMKALNLQNRTCAIVENGSWAIRSGSLMRECLECLKHMTILDDGVTIASSLQSQNLPEMDALADALANSIKG